VDDLISGGDSVEEVRVIRHQVKELLSRGHFPIRKWCSNESAVLEGESECNKEQLIKFHDGSDVGKALGATPGPFNSTMQNTTILQAPGSEINYQITST